MVAVIWDFFLCEGWKGLFKSIIWILKQHQAQLLKLQFDEILHYLGELIKSDFFNQTVEVVYPTLKKEINDI
jgi:hypothetical protein